MTIICAAPKYARAATNAEGTFKLTFPVEKVRVIMYICFWGFVFVAKAITRVIVVPMLREGSNETDIERRGCGPFNRNFETKPNPFNLSYGEGFDYDTESHLQQEFGFSNVCTSWDYTPAREIVAIIFPFFEYSMVLYIFLNGVMIFIAFGRGQLPVWYKRLSYVLTPLTIFLAICFRHIFVNIAYEQVSMHTLGFLCLQFAIVITAIMNVVYILLTSEHYSCNTISEGTIRYLAKIYLALNLPITAVKIYATCIIVATNTGPKFYKHPVSMFGGIVFGRLVDLAWMSLNALLPAFLALWRSKHEDPLTIEFSLPKCTFRGEDDAELSTETTRLVD